MGIVITARILLHIQIFIILSNFHDPSKLSKRNFFVKVKKRNERSSSKNILKIYVQYNRIILFLSNSLSLWSCGYKIVNTELNKTSKSNNSYLNNAVNLIEN